jgi:hypothetical protein
VEKMRKVKLYRQLSRYLHIFYSSAFQFDVVVLFLEASNEELICARTKYALSTKFSGGLASGLDEYARSNGSPHQAVIYQLSSSVCCHFFTSKCLYREKIEVL